MPTKLDDNNSSFVTNVKKSDGIHRPIKTYSRSKSRALTVNQKRLMNDFLPKVDALKNFKMHLIKHKFKRISLEIGFGSGENLLHQAYKNPDTLYIGAEPYLNGVVKVLNAIEEKSINNILIHASDARELFALFKEHSIILYEVFILFPDPWPKIKHYKKRLINNYFLELLIEVMNIESKLYIATDHINYMEWITDSLNYLIKKIKYQYNNTPFYDNIASKYQKKGANSGRKLHYFCVCKEL